jgi:hypothetical protein
MIERQDEYDPHTPLCTSFNSSMPSSLEMHFVIIPLGTLSKHYPINQVVHPRLACDALDFGVIV